MACDIALFDDFDAVERDADGALSRDRQSWLFDRLSWFRLVRKYTPEGEPLVIRVRNGVAQCWLFLAARESKATAMSNWYCLRFGPVIDAPAGGQPPLEELAKGLRRAGITHIYLSPVAQQEPLAAALRRRGWMTRLSPDDFNWRICTKGVSFEEYWASRPSRLRNTAARRARKTPLDIVVHDRFDAAAWADYEAVYEASWKPSEGSPELVREMAQDEDRVGALRLGLAYHQGQAVAGQFWVIDGGVATIHKLAYRDDARDLSPGTLLSMEMFRRALDVDHVEMIDFGIGDHPYKAEWMSHCVPLYALSAYDMLRPGGMFGLVRSVGAGVARRLRPRPPS